MRFISFIRMEVMLYHAVRVMSYHLYSMLNIHHCKIQRRKPDIITNTEKHSIVHLAFTIIEGVIFMSSFTVLLRVVLLFLTAEKMWEIKISIIYKLHCDHPPTSNPNRVITIC